MNFPQGALGAKAWKKAQKLGGGKNRILFQKGKDNGGYTTAAALSNAPQLNGGGHKRGSVYNSARADRQRKDSMTEEEIRREK